MRTDVHSPKNLITEDYEYVASGYGGSNGEPGYSPLAHEARYLIDEGWTMAENESAGDCYHCGANLKYYAILKHLPTRTLVRVGEVCLDNRFELATRDFQKLRKEARLNRERIKMVERREAFEEANREVCDFITEANRASLAGEWNDEFMESLWSQLQRKGELSERQIEVVQKKIVQRAERTAAKEKIDAAMPDPSPCPEGRIEVTGLVLSVKVKPTDFGPVLKMTVVDDRGFKVWGSVPSDLASIPVYDDLTDEGRARLEARIVQCANAAEGTSDWMDRVRAEKILTDGRRVNHQRSIERGERVSFTATVTKSDNDVAFGFFKRPSKARVL